MMPVSRNITAVSRGSLPRPAFYAALNRSVLRKAALERSAIAAAPTTPSTSIHTASSASFSSPARWRVESQEKQRRMDPSRTPPRRAFSSTRATFDTPRSPFAVFVQTLKEELKKSQMMQENLQQLQGEAGKINDSESMKQAKAAYERMRIVASIKENPRLQAAAEQLKKSGGQISTAVGETLRQMEDSELIKGLSAVSSRLARQLDESTAPIRKTEAYQALSQTLTEAFDDGGSALRLHFDKEADAKMVRKLKREARLRKIGRPPPVDDVDTAPKVDEEILRRVRAMGITDPEEVFRMAQSIADAGVGKKKEPEAEPAEGAEAAEEGADAESKTAAEGEAATPGEGSAAPAEPATPPPPPRKLGGFAVRTRSMAVNANAGEALVLKEEPAYKQAWSNFRGSNPVFRKLSDWRMAYDESENPVVERLRGITETIGGWFEENETVQVVRAFRSMEPTFTMEKFQRELREYVVPEFIDAYHGAQRHILRQWCGEATYNVLMATVEPYLQKGYIAQGRLLDLKGVEILQGKMLENNVPVLVVSFQSQELMFFTDPKTGEIKAGKSDQTDLCRYAMVLTRVEEELDNEITGGWKVVELARRGQASFL